MFNTKFFMLKLNPNFALLVLWGILSFCLPPGLSAQSSDGWVLKNEKAGVKVYYRKTSDIHELKLVTSIKAPMSGIAHLLDDVDNFTVWGYKVSEARLVKRISATEMYYYARIDFPWPMSDRDLVLHTKMEQNIHSNVLTSTSNAVSGWVPELKDVVRIKKTTSKWTVMPGTGGWLGLEYYLHSDPGGNLPDWAINLALDTGPRETVKQMKDTLKHPRYQNTKLAHIKE
jgi:hypothetical protein